MKVFKTAALGAAIMAASLSTAHAGATFDAVKAKGFVQCGVNTGLSGFSMADSQGVWRGLDVLATRANSR